MPELRVLMIYPNLQMETLVSPALALFSALLKREGFKVILFDTTNYQLESETQFATSTGRIQMSNLNIRPFEATAQKKILNVYENLRQKIGEFDPNLILVTATENMFPIAINLLKHIDDLEIPVILGGVFATFAPELAMRHKEIDMLCVGEGERPLVDLCRRMARGEDYSNVPGLWARMKDNTIKKNLMGPLSDMNENPLPDYSIFEDTRIYRPMAGKIYRILPIETHRGCPYACRFCNSPAQNILYKSNTGQIFSRYKSSEKIREELLYCRDIYNAQYFFFWADTFFAWPEREFDKFCEMYKDIRIPFFCQTRPETIVEKRIKKLKELGIHRMGFGIEHGNEKFRKEIIGRSCANSLIVEKMKIVNQYDIPFSANNIIGFPRETRKLVFDTIELNRHIASDTMTCSIFMPYCGTKLRKLAITEGYLHLDTICPTNSDNTVLDMPAPYLDRKEIKNLQKVLAMYIKFPKNRWPEITKAEASTPEGDKSWKKLREEFIETFFA